jgi:hypothetical protein
MPWGKPQKHGWGSTPEEEPATRFSQVIRTIISLVPGGVIRYAKDGPDDDSHTGFWLGVTPEGVAKFSIGGPAGWLKWDGTKLVVRGSLSTWSSDQGADYFAFVGRDGKFTGYLKGTDAWGHFVELAVPRSVGEAGDPSFLDLFVDGDPNAGLRLRLWTEYGGGKAASKCQLQVGNGHDVVVVSGEDDSLWVRGPVKCADPAGDTHALTRRAGDGRYVSKAAGWSGSFRTDEIATVTVVDGQITAVA